MPIKRFSNRKDDASEVASELASELSLVDRGGVNIVEAEVVEDKDNFVNDEY